jgi:hypothetical protein
MSNPSRSPDRSRRHRHRFADQILTKIPTKRNFGLACVLYALPLMIDRKLSRKSWRLCNPLRVFDDTSVDDLSGQPIFAQSVPRSAIAPSPVCHPKPRTEIARTSGR